MRHRLRILLLAIALGGAGGMTPPPAHSRSMPDSGAPSAATAAVQLAQVRAGRPGGGGGGGGGIPLGGIIGNIITNIPPPDSPPPPSKVPKSKVPQAAGKTTTKGAAVRPPGPGVAVAPESATEIRQRAGEVLTLVSAGQPPEVEDELAARFGLERIELQQVALLDGRVQLYRILVNVDVDAMVASLASDPRVIIAQPNFLYREAQQQGAAANRLPQYALDKLGVPPAHGIAKGRDVVVAVIDTGVDTAHPALKDAILETFNAVSDGGYVAHKHGTSVAGIIAGHGQVEGVAPSAKLLAVRALYLNTEFNRPETTSYILLKAIDWAFARAARIFNFSLTGPQDPLVATILNVSESKGAVHVAAAGNGGPRAAPAYPAAYDSVVGVTATDVNDRLYAIANQGDYLELAAPGVNIIAPTSAGKFGYSSGTSLAAAHVSGLVALMREVDADIGSDEVRAALMESAKDLGPKGRDRLYGAGRPDAMHMLRRGNAAR